MKRIIAKHSYRPCSVFDDAVRQHAVSLHDADSGGQDAGRVLRELARHPQGKSVWRFGITATTFRSGDRYYNYEQVLDLGDGTYDVTVVLGEHRRRFLFRAITPSSMEYQPFPRPIFGGWIMSSNEMKLGLHAKD